ncbi:hypothetical protein C3L33_01367, partial [Rhododendron williamsianum]
MFFDLQSPTSSRQFHCNIQAAKSSSDVKSYIEKGGVYVDDGVFQVDGRSARGGQQAIAEVYAEALNAPSKLIALQIIKEKDPKSYVLQFHNINANLDKIFATPPTPYVNPFPPGSFNQVPNEMIQWGLNNVKDSAQMNSSDYRNLAPFLLDDNRLNTENKTGVDTSEALSNVLVERK